MHDVAAIEFALPTDCDEPTAFRDWAVTYSHVLTADTTAIRLFIPGNYTTFAFADSLNSRSTSHVSLVSPAATAGVVPSVMCG
jgi:hypothetical protein